MAAFASPRGYAGPQWPEPAVDRPSLASAGDAGALWETDDGKKIKLGDLNGRVRVISMFYSTCQGVCVITKQDMQAIEASLSPAARRRVGFVLVTLAPGRDTAQALRSYRRDEGLSNERWTLLRGDDASTSKLAALLGVVAGRDSSGRYIHGSQLVVLDESGRVIHTYGGLRADLHRIAAAVEAAALSTSITSARPTAIDAPPEGRAAH
jgi:protein SCO1/2